jgi:hypothetical protein
MGARGVHFALTDLELGRLLGHKRPARRLAFLQEELEEHLFEQEPDRVCETDKAWDAIHRSLTNGSLEAGRGMPPAFNVILGGDSLYDRADYIMSLKTIPQVREIASFLQPLTEKSLREGYGRIDEHQYDGTLSDDDFGYTWAYFQQLREFYDRAAREAQCVLFTVDQ